MRSPADSAHLLLASTEDDAHLEAELRRADYGAFSRLAPPGLFSLAAPPDLPPPRCVFVRQTLPRARSYQAESIRQWSEWLTTQLIAELPPDQPWLLHVVPHFGAAAAGVHRCQLIHDATRELLKRRQRQLRRHLASDPPPQPEPWSPLHSLAQLLLVSPTEGWLSIAPAPLPSTLGPSLSPFPKGEVPVAIDKSAPSRAFAKLVEAELRLGHRIQPGDRCVDLGACPGSWSYVALHRGAHVLAIDRAELREDLMGHPRLRFLRGDAFRHEPESPVDWLLCDVIAAPQRTLDLLDRWIQHRWCRGFVVTVKFKGAAEYPLIDPLKESLTSRCEAFLVQRLCANKNEVAVAGVLHPVVP